MWSGGRRDPCLRRQIQLACSPPREDLFGTLAVLDVLAVLAVRELENGTRARQQG